MSPPPKQPAYKEFVAKTTALPPAPKRKVEDEVDGLLTALRQREQEAAAVPDKQDPLTILRRLTVNEFVPAFVELVEKYSKSGVSMQMDASNLLEGGREIKFEFALGEFRTQLHGTATSDGIAFHETRYSPGSHGELATGPMLRYRALNANSFREFVCSQLASLIRNAMRKR